MVTFAILQIIHYPFAGVVLGLGLINTVVFGVLALVEIHT